MCSILVIDRAAGAELIAGQLSAEGYFVETSAEAEPGVARVLQGAHDLVILDASPPGMSGLAALRRIRDHSLLPVLMLSASPEEAERVLALELGADDYLRRPCPARELAARVRAILRRASTGVGGFGHLVGAGDLELDRLRRKVRKGGEEVALTAAEFDLLDALLQAPGRAVPREALARAILGRGLNVNDRSIDMHVSNLRRKLGRGRDGAERIRAVRGVGYLYALSAD